jgi:uncharacterized RDD family membrane protein YckC
MTTQRTASIWRRLGAIFYDSLIIYTLWVVATFIAVALNHGKAIPPGNIPYRLTLLAILFFYFVMFWMRGGQTVGLRIWRCRLVSTDEHPVGFVQASRRFIWAMPSLLLAGVGLWWQLFDKQNLALHDRLSKTKINHAPSP